MKKNNFNFKAMEKAQDIIASKKYIEKLSYENLWQRFLKNNEGERRKEYVLLDVDTNKAFTGMYKEPIYKYFITSSQQKVWESWAGGYSLFATCICDGQTERFERIFNYGNVKAAYVISKEVLGSIDKLVELK